MRSLTLSMVLMGSFFLVGCGGGSSSKSQVNTATTVQEAEKNYEALSALDSLNEIFGDDPTLQKSKLIQKSEGEDFCAGGGSLSMPLYSENEIKIVFDKCVDDGTYLDGTFWVRFSDNEQHYYTDLKDVTIKDAEVSLYSSHLVIEEDDIEQWTTIDGDMKITTQCASNSYEIKTLEKIYNAQDGSDNAERGILKINGATYTFDNPYVTIQVGDEQQRVLQSSLDAGYDDTEECS